MWLFDTKRLEVKEYVSSAVQAAREAAKLASKTHTFPVTPRRLAVGLARTLLSRDPLSWDLAFETVGAFFQIQTSIYGSATDLRLAPGFASKYRDFSRSGRCGHIAQALAYVVAQKVLRFPLVIDFEGYVAAEGGDPSQGRGKRPDFVLVRPGSTGIAVMEASGSERGSITQLLRKGLAQTANAQAFGTAAGVSLPIASRFSFAALLREHDSHKSTELAFCDPPDDFQSWTFPWKAVHRSYASWLAFAGHFDLAGFLMDGRYDPLLRRLRTVDVLGRTILTVEHEFPSSWPWFWPIPISGGLVSNGISQDTRIGFDRDTLYAVIERREVQLRNALQSIEQFIDEVRGQDRQPHSSRVFEVFPDGTLLLNE